MGLCGKKIERAAIVAALLLTGSGVWASEPISRRSAPAANLVDVDLNSVVVEEPQTTVKRPHGATASDGPVPDFFEDFQGGVMPAGWLLVDNDGLTPDPNVAQFTDAWIVAEDFDNAGDFVAMSTSWYSPPGTADDWIITPDIPIGPSKELTWRAEAQDPNFPDGYNVHVSTTGQSLAGCQAGPQVFSIAAETGGVWTGRSVDLSSFDGQTVNICFQNNSNDQFILMIDDIGVSSIVVTTTDAAVTAVERMSEYGRVPHFPFLYPATLGGTVSNLGTTEITNVVLTARLFLNGAPIQDLPGIPIPSLSPGASQAVHINEAVISGFGVWSTEYEVTMTETDDDPANNLAMAPSNLLITPDQLGRDDDMISGTLGIGAGVPGELGSQFTLHNPATLEAAIFAVGPFDPPPPGVDGIGIVGTTTWVTVWDMAAGAPNSPLATTEIHTFVDYDQHTLTLAFPTPVELPAGDYVLTVHEDLENIALNYSNDVFTAGTTWIDWPGNPFGTWAHNEDFGFNVTYILRAVLSYPTLSVTKDGTGLGTVISNPVGIDCGAACSVDFPTLSAVTLTPTPDPGSIFMGWGGDPDCSDGDVIMDMDKTCNATFDLNQSTLSITKNGSGTGVVTTAPAGIVCGAVCSFEFTTGTPVDLIATPDPGSILTGWSGDPDCTDGQITMSTDIMCNATFEIPLFADGFEDGTTNAWDGVAGGM